MPFQFVEKKARSPEEKLLALKQKLNGLMRGAEFLANSKAPSASLVGRAVLSALKELDGVLTD